MQTLIAQLFSKAYGPTEYRGFQPPAADAHLIRAAAKDRMEGAVQRCRAILVWNAQQPLHWHYVTLGLTELDTKVSNDAARNGWGYELTFRLPRSPPEAAPPEWPLPLLSFLVNSTYQTHGAVDEGHYLDLRGWFPPEYGLVGATVVADPTFPEVYQTPHGRTRLLQLVGVTADELDAIARVDDRRVVAALSAADSLLITKPRSSVFAGGAGPSFPQATPPPPIAGSLIVSGLLVGRSPLGWPEVSIAGLAHALLAQMLLERIPAGLPVRVCAPDAELRFVPADQPAWAQQNDGNLEVACTPEILRALVSALQSSTQRSAVELPGIPLRFRR